MWLLISLPLLFFLAAPVVAILLRVSPAGLLENLNNRTVVQAISLSLTTTAITLVISMVAGTPVAYLLARYRSRAAGPVNAVVVGGFALPGLVIALSLVAAALARDELAPLYQGYGLLIVAYVVHFGAQALRAGQVAVGAVPQRLVDAAQILGARRARALRTVELPLMAPGLAAGGGLVLLSVMKELPVTLLLAPIGTETLATRIWFAYNEAMLAEAGLAALVLLCTSAALTWLLVLRRGVAA